MKKSVTKPTADGGTDVIPAYTMGARGALEVRGSPPDPSQSDPLHSHRFAGNGSIFWFIQVLELMTQMLQMLH